MQVTVTATAGDQAPPAMAPATNAPWARTSGPEPTRWLVRRCGRLSRRPPNQSAPPAGRTMLGKIWRTSVTAALLLASPAFAQPAQLDALIGQRIIRELVVNGGLMGVDSDEPSANELRPVMSWIEQGSDLDRRSQHVW